jgi:Holliday junction resolvase RusA-like endonuclease
MNSSHSGHLVQAAGNSAHLCIVPMPKPRMTRSDRWKQRPVVMRYWAFKDELQLLAREKDFVLGAAFEVTFYLPMPDSWSKKKKQQMNGQKHQQKPDLDNCEKALMDCLAPESDAYIWAKVSKKVWAYDGAIAIKNLELTQ